MDTLWTKNYTLITIANLLFFTGFQMVVPILPLYIEDMGGSNIIIGLVVAGGTLGAIVTRPFAGRLVNSYGRMPVYMVSLLLCTAVIFSYAFCRIIILLLIVRILHGMCMGVTTTASTTIVTDLLPRTRLAEGMGFFGLASTIAMCVSPALALYLINIVDYSTVFFVAFGFFVLTLVFSLLLKPPPPRMTAGAPRGALYERRALLPAILMFFQTCSYSAVATYLAVYGTHLGIYNIGLYFTVYALAIIVCRLWVGRLADRRGYHIVLIPSQFLSALSFVFLAFGQSIGMFLISAALLGAGFGAAFPTLQALGVRDVTPERRGAANATVMTGFDVGFGVGAICWGLVAQWTSYATVYLLNIPMMLIPAITYLVVWYRRRGAALPRS